jgi:hypothetical protein
MLVRNQIKQSPLETVFTESFGFLAFALCDEEILNHQPLLGSRRVARNPFGILGVITSLYDIFDIDSDS